MAQTAIVVPPSESLDHAIRPFRLAHTQSGPRGLPAHVTLLFPFADTADLTDSHTERIAAIVGAVPAFEVRFTRTGYLPGTPRILYVEPDPAEPFRALTQALTEAFPEHPPYEGAYDEVIPHATVAIADDDTLAAVEQAVEARLPRRARVEEAWLVALDAAGERWETRARFPFG